MNTANPYAAPQSDVNSEVGGSTGSVEDALAGRYDFQIGEVMSEAWRLTSGFKLTWWGTYLVVLFGSMILSFILGMIFAVAKLGVAGQVIVQIISTAIGLVVAVGMVMQVVRRAGGLPISVGTAFSYFDRWLTALGAGLLVIILVLIGLLLLIVPGIYLSTTYQMVFPLIGDRKMGVWQAMETSRKALTHRWGKIFLTYVAAGLLACAPALLLIPVVLATKAPAVIFLAAVVAIIPMFWTLPWLYLVVGVLYRRIFGVASAT